MAGGRISSFFWVNSFCLAILVVTAFAKHQGQFSPLLKSIIPSTDTSHFIPALQGKKILSGKKEIDCLLETIRGGSTSTYPTDSFLRPKTTSTTLTSGSSSGTSRTKSGEKMDEGENNKKESCEKEAIVEDEEGQILIDEGTEGEYEREMQSSEIIKTKVIKGGKNSPPFFDSSLISTTSTSTSTAESFPSSNPTKLNASVYKSSFNKFHQEKIVDGFDYRQRSNSNHLQQGHHHPSAFQMEENIETSMSDKEEEDQLYDSPIPYKVAYYVTGHGLGHATRVIETCRSLIKRGHDVTVCTLIGDYVFKREMPDIHVRNLVEPYDIGGLQIDALSVDPVKTLEEYKAQVHDRRSIILDRESKWLTDEGIDMVISDATPIICTAAKQANIPAFVVSNLVWDHIYEDYIPYEENEEKRAIYQEMVNTITADYRNAEAILRLPGASSMKKQFQKIFNMPMVVRQCSLGKEEIRERLGIPLDVKVALLSFGGQKTSWDELMKDTPNILPEGWYGVVLEDTEEKHEVKTPLTSSSQQIQHHSKIIKVPRDTFFPDLVVASDVILGKIGYGTVSECIAHNRPLVYVPRLHWNEQKFLIDLMNREGTLIRMPREEFVQNNWGKFLEAATIVHSKENTFENQNSIFLHNRRGVPPKRLYEGAADKVCKKLENLMANILEESIAK